MFRTPTVDIDYFNASYLALNMTLGSASKKRVIEFVESRQPSIKSKHRMRSDNVHLLHKSLLVEFARWLVAAPCDQQQCESETEADLRDALSLAAVSRNLLLRENARLASELMDEE
jgi:hypothetical protein